jgi:hypothetical protein
MSDARAKQAEWLQFLSDYQTAFTTRADGSSWPIHERTWLNVGDVVNVVFLAELSEKYPR